MWLAPSQPCLAPKGNGIKMTPIPGLNLLRTLVQACYQTTVLYIRKWWRNYKFQREFKNKFELLGDKRFKVAWKDRLGGKNFSKAMSISSYRHWFLLTFCHLNFRLYPCGVLRLSARKNCSF